MKLKLDGTLGIMLMMIMELLKLELPEDPEEEIDIPMIVSVVGEEPSPTTPTTEQADIIESIIDHTYPSPIVIFDDTETERIERETLLTTSVTDIYTVPTTIDRTIHRTIE